MLIALLLQCVKCPETATNRHTDLLQYIQFTTRPMNTFDDSQVEDFQSLEEFMEQNMEEIMNHWNHEDFPIDKNGIATQR
jgi:hypothetical protein